MIQLSRIQIVVWLAVAIGTLSFVRSSVVAQDTVTLNRNARRGSKLLVIITDFSQTVITVSSSVGERRVPVIEIQRIGLCG